MKSNDKIGPASTRLRQLLIDHVIPRTLSAKIVWVSGIVIMLLSAFHFIIEYAPRLFPSLLHDHTALTDFIYSLDVSYETSALTSLAGALLMGGALTMPGANPRTHN